MTATYKKSINTEENDVLTIEIDVNDVNNPDSAYMMRVIINGQPYIQLVGTHPQTLEDEAIMEFEAWKQRKNIVPIERDKWFEANGYEIVNQ